MSEPEYNYLLLPKLPRQEYPGGPELWTYYRQMLAALNLEVQEMNDGNHFRVAGIVDFWPSTGTWLALGAKSRGRGYAQMVKFLQGPKAKALKERAATVEPAPKPWTKRAEPPPKTIPLDPGSQVVLCTYCNKPAVLVNGTSLYRNRPDLAKKKFWKCDPCEAWVGCHAGGSGQEPVGTLANANLRVARMNAHAAFDPLWQSGHMSRDEAYAWMRETLGISAEECHIGMMSATRCKKVIEAIKTRRPKAGKKAAPKASADS